jgi:hypothetical protein
MAISDGGPAFPQVLSGNPILIMDGSTITLAGSGMSLRDWFAGQALNGLMSDSEARSDLRPREVAIDCYNMADAMLVARERK